MAETVRIAVGNPGEARIILVGKSQEDKQNLTVAFPQFPTLSPQKPLNQQIEGNDLILTVDADALADIIEVGSPCQIRVPELNITGTVIWPEIEGRRGNARQVVDFNRPKAQPLPEDQTISTVEEENIPEEPSTPTIKEETEEPLPEKPIEEITAVETKTKRNSIWVIASIASILILGGGGYFAFHEMTKKKEHAPVTTTTGTPSSKEAKNTPQPKNPEPAKPPATVPPENPFSNMSVQDVINKAPNVNLIAQEGKRRLANQKADDGVLLLENAASRGDASAMLQLALLYDPLTFKNGGPIPSPDMREAARYLQKAAQAGSADAATPRSALHDWLQTKANGGDEMARLTLKDFWP